MQTDLGIQVAQWSTPTVADTMTTDGSLRPSRIETGRTTDYLARQAQQWAYPRAAERSQRNTSDNHVTVGYQVKQWATPNCPNGGRAIPEDVERRGNTLYSSDGRKLQIDLNHEVKQWSTPRSSDTNGIGAHGDGGLDLRTQVSLWKSPRVSRGKYTRDSGDPEKERLTLEGEVKQWPSPAARDIRSEECTSEFAEQRNAETRGKPLTWAVKDGQSGSLNPEWEELLMNWPTGWTDPDSPCSGVWPGFPAGQGPFQYDYEPPRTVPKGTISNRTKRVEMIGNGVVPMQAAAAFILLLSSL